MKISDPWVTRAEPYPLASWIADLPEQHLLACVLGNQSPFSTVTHDEFGDDYNHPHCTHDHTLQRIRHACLQTIPTFIPTFLKTCQLFGLNGIHQPFWRDWGDADPSQFLTLDALHTWHKFVFDHGKNGPIAHFKIPKLEGL